MSFFLSRESEGADMGIINILSIPKPISIVLIDTGIIDSYRYYLVQKGMMWKAVEIRDGSRFSNIQIFYLIIEYRLGCAIIF